MHFIPKREIFLRVSPFWFLYLQPIKKINTMNKSFFITALLLLLPFLTSAQSINTTASTVEFSIPNMLLNTVKGTFTGMNGEVKFYPKKLTASVFNVCIDASTVNTGNETRDSHLKQEDYFNITTYPNICFSSSAISKTDKGYNTKGQLTMNGITKTIEIPFTFENNTLIGNTHINRTDFNIGGSGGFMIGQKAKLTIKCVLK